MSRRLPMSVLVAVSLVSWTSAPPARAQSPSVNWLSYLGSDRNDSFGDLLCDSQTGDVFVTGTASALVAGAPDQGLPSGDSILTARFSAGGALKAWNVIGGNKADVGRAIVYSGGRLFIAGSSDSDVFTAAPREGTREDSPQDGFLAELNPDDLRAKWLYGLDINKKAEVIHDMAVMSDGSLIVVGVVAPSVAEITSSAASTDAFVARILPPGPTKGSTLTLLWSNAWKGGSSDAALAVAVDSNDNIYVAGRTVSTDLIETPPPARYHNPDAVEDAFIVRVDKNNGGILAGTYFGGFGKDEVTGLAVNADALFAVGTSIAPNIPGDSDTSSGMLNRAFVTKFNKDTLVHLRTRTLGSGTKAHDEGRSIALVGNRLYVGGIVHSNNFPGATDPIRGAEGFVARIDIDASPPQIVSSTLIKGEKNDAVLGLGGSVVDGKTILFFGGNTDSSDLNPPDTGGANYSHPQGDIDLFFGRLDVDPPPTPDGGIPGDAGSPMDGGSATDGESATDGGGPGSPDGGSGLPGPRSPLGFSCGANASGGGPGVMALVSLLGLALLAAARRDRRG